MSETQEHLEHMEHAQHAANENKKIALLIAILALFLSFSETLGKSAQTEAIDANVRSADSWAFSQAKDIRLTTLRGLASQTELLTSSLTDPAGKAAVAKQISTWRATAARYESDPKTGTGLKELREKARHEEEERDLAMAKYHHYEIASAAFQVGIVLASAMVITGIMALAWLAGGLGVIGLAMLALGVFAPHALTIV